MSIKRKDNTITCVHFKLTLLINHFFMPKVQDPILYTP